MSDRERYKTRHTVEQFFARIKEHKRLIARFDKLDTTFFSFFALACLNVLKHFVNSATVYWKKSLIQRAPFDPHFIADAGFAGRARYIYENWCFPALRQAHKRQRAECFKKLCFSV